MSSAADIKRLNAVLAKVLDGMKRLFDGVAQGATEYLAGVPVEALTDLDWKGDW